MLKNGKIRFSAKAPVSLRSVRIFVVVVLIVAVFLSSASAASGEDPAGLIDLSAWPELPRQQRTVDAPSRLISAQRKYERLIDNQQFDRLLDHAVRLVDIAAEEVGTDHVEYAIALSSLGAAYFHVGDYHAATIALEESVRGIRKHFGGDSEELIGPLAYLGTAYQRLRLHTDATQRLAQARKITRQLFGDDNPYQIKLVYPLAESAMALREYEQVEDYLRYAVALSETEFGTDSAPYREAVLLLGDWLAIIHEYDAALTEYRRIEKAVVANTAQGRRSRVRALQGMSLSNLRIPEASKDRALSFYRESLGVIESEPRDFSPTWRILSQVRMADLSLLFGLDESAREHLSRSWELAEKDDGYNWKGFFSEPMLLQSGGQLTYKASRQRDNGDAAYALFEFDIDEDGRPHNVVILEDNLHATFQSQAVEAFREAQYRPPLTDGVPRAVKGLRYRRDYSASAPDGSEMPTGCPEMLARQSFRGVLGYSRCASRSKR